VVPLDTLMAECGTQMTGHDRPPRSGLSSARMTAAQLGDLRRLGEIIAVQQELASQPDDRAAIGEIVVARMKTLTSADAAVVELVDGDEMVYAAASGTLQAHVGRRLKIASSLSGLAIREGETFACEDCEHDPRVDKQACRAVGVRSMIVAPLFEDERAIGVLKVAYLRPQGFTVEDVLVVRLLAGLIGSALARADSEAARSRAEAALRESEESFRNAFERLPEGVLIHAEGEILWTNASLVSLLGYSSAAELVGTNAIELIHPDHVAATRARGAGQSPTGALVEHRLVRRDGETVHVDVLRESVLFQGRGATLVVVRDLSAHKRIADELLRARDLAESANRAKSAFVASMSHDLRTPLNAIIGFSELLEDGVAGPLGPRQLGFIQHVVGSGRHLLALVNDVLDVAKVEAGRLDLERTLQHIGPVLSDVVEEVAPLAARKTIALSSDIASELPEILIDRTRMRQVFLNVLSNAIKFTKSGGSVRVTAQSDDWGVVVRVRDTGIGIAAEDVPKLFRPFAQLGSIANRAEGTGLGLLLSRKLLELHGGRIELESELGVGTTVTVTLPCESR